MAHSRVNKHSSKKQTASSHTIIETAPKAALLMLCSGLFVILISAAIGMNASSPLSLSTPLALVSLYVGAMAGGFFCQKRLEGADGYVCAAISSLLIALLMFFSRLIIPAPEARTELIPSMICHVMIVAVAMLGAILARNTQRKRRKKKSHYRS